MKLEGKVAIITGGASGIGRATALRYAREGARVVVADINAEGGQSCVEAIVAGGGEGVFSHTDVSDDDALARMVDLAVSTYGGLDILHNNAYRTEARTALETTPENWQQTLNVTLRPTWFTSKLAVPALRARGGGVILNTASIHSLVGVPGYAAYQAAKGGMLALTRAMALELAPEIRVVAILPGAIDTPAVHISEDISVADLIADIPLGRLGTPEEIAGLAAYLASDEAAYITGSGIVIDGGYTTR